MIILLQRRATREESGQAAIEGETWNYAGLKGEPFCCLAFDPYVKNMVYAATLDSLPFAAYLFPDGSYNREKIGRLYRSTDKGKTWDTLFEKRGVSFTNLAFDKDNPAVILASFRNDGIYKSTDGGKTFAKKTTSMGMADFSTISPDPTNSSIFYAAVCQYPSPNNDASVPLYGSKDTAKRGTSSKRIIPGVTLNILRRSTSAPNKSAGRSQNLSPIIKIQKNSI